MNWLNINTSTLRSSLYLGASLQERAVWLQLLSYCVDQENGGRMKGAVGWKNKQWMQACGVAARDVKNAKELITIKGQDVCVAFFPLDKQNEVQEKRASGKRGGSSRSEEKVAAARKNGALGGRPRTSQKTEEEPELTQCQNPSTNPTEGERNRKGREMEVQGEIERKGMYASSAGTAPPVRGTPPVDPGESRGLEAFAFAKGEMPDFSTTAHADPPLESLWRTFLESHCSDLLAIGLNPEWKHSGSLHPAFYEWMEMKEAS